MVHFIELLTFVVRIHAWYFFHYLHISGRICVHTTYPIRSFLRGGIVHQNGTSKKAHVGGQHSAGGPDRKVFLILCYARCLDTRASRRLNTTWALRILNGETQIPPVHTSPPCQPTGSGHRSERISFCPHYHRNWKHVLIDGSLSGHPCFVGRLV